MQRESLNVYCSGILGLQPEDAVSRKMFIEEGAAAADLVELLEEWSWTYNLDEGAALKLKIWLGLDVSTLGMIFRRSPRDILQLLRNQRVSLLPAYPPPERSHETLTIAGLSCFMVEQYLSSWIDHELAEVKMGEALVAHCGGCAPCRERLEAYRKLNQEILKSRPMITPVTAKEWDVVLKEERDLSRRSLRRWLVILFVVLAGVSTVAWALWSKPEKVPNVYEMPEG